jgi:putative NADPH-quinone reductase
MLRHRYATVAQARLLREARETQKLMHDCIEMGNQSRRAQALQELAEQIQALADNITEAQALAYQYPVPRAQAAISGRRMVAVLMEEMRELVLLHG